MNLLCGCSRHSIRKYSNLGATAKCEGRIVGCLGRDAEVTTSDIRAPSMGVAVISPEPVWTVADKIWWNSWLPTVLTSGTSESPSGVAERPILSDPGPQTENDGAPWRGLAGLLRALLIRVYEIVRKHLRTSAFPVPGHAAKTSSDGTVDQVIAQVDPSTSELLDSFERAWTRRPKRRVMCSNR